MRTKTTIALMVVAFVPSVVLAVVWYRTAVEGLTRSVNGSLLAAASRASASIDAIVSAALDAMRVQSQLPTLEDVFTTPDPRVLGRAAEVLVTLRSADSINIASYSLLGADGRVLLSTDPRRATGSVFGDPFVSAVLGSKRPLMTPVRFRDHSDPVGYFRVAAAMRDRADGVRGILVAEFSASLFDQVVHEQTRLLGPGAHGVLYDTNDIRTAGTLQADELFRTTNPLDSARRAALETAQRLLPRASGGRSVRRVPRNMQVNADSTYTFTLLRFDGNDAPHTYLAAGARLRAFAGRVSLEMPQEAALGSTSASLVRDALLLALIIIVVVGTLAVMLGRRMTRPLEDLTETARRFADGDRDVRVTVRSTDETGRLGEAFNELAGRVDNLVTGLNERTALLEADIRERERLEFELVQTRKLEAVGRLAGGIAHDFNNLLTVVAQNVELAREEAPLEPAAHEALDDIADAARRGAALTRQLLAFARRGATSPRVIDLSTVVRSSQRLLRQLLGSPVALRCDITEHPTPVLADPTQIEQVLVNLASNARDAMPRGGELQITVRESPSDATFPDGALELVVADSGVGMDAEVAARAFEPFYTTKDAGRGTGLGLATVYGIVTGIGGTVTIDSAVGRGTAFTLRLPRSTASSSGTEAAPADAAPTAPAPAPATRPATILLVEDESAVRHAIARRLRRLGHTVHEAGDGAEGLALGQLHGTRIELLISDVMMAGADGFTVARTLRAAHPTLRVLMMSGYADEARARFETEELKLVILEKPFTLDALSARVASVLASA